MYEKYKNSYKVTEKELVSLSVYNVGFQRCDSLYQWGPGIRDHYLIHYIISGKGFYQIGKRTYELQAAGSFLAYSKHRGCLLRCRSGSVGICMGRFYRQ
mgnify:CR=1 FL=1